MNTLVSDEELRSELDAAKRVLHEKLQGGLKEAQARAAQAGADFETLKAAYHRLGCLAAQRWGLLR